MESANGPGHFPVTRWTLIERLRVPGDSSRQALEDICRSYWKPLLVHARGRGVPASDAEDVVQEFFRVALRRELFHAAEPGRRRLRSLLLRAFQNHLRDVVARARAEKRHAEGGLVPFDEELGDGAVGGTAAAGDAAFDREWARAVVGLAVDAVRAAYAKEGDAARVALFEALLPRLVNDDDTTADAEDAGRLAARLGMKEASLRVASHRLRTRFREALRETVRATLADESTLDEELGYLRQCLATHPQ